MERKKHWYIAFIGLLALALLPPLTIAIDQPFYVTLFSRIMIFAIAAVSLDLIMGHGGLLSFGHAVYLGIGAYSVGILTHYGVTSGSAHFLVAIVAAAIAALLIGAVSLRTSGGYFIMITLAFTQMFFFLFTSVKVYGGDDGLNISSYSSFGPLIDFNNGYILYYAIFFILALFVYLSGRITESRFGMVIRGARINERRMAALGVPVFRYRLTAFVISGVMCSVAGALLANLNLFVSPAIMHWSRSGELMMMVIIGGTATLFGPVLGALFYLVLEDTVSGMLDNWQLIIGPVLLIFVLFVKSGILGLFRLPIKKHAHG